MRMMNGRNGKNLVIRYYISIFEVGSLLDQGMDDEFENDEWENRKIKYYACSDLFVYFDTAIIIH